MEGHAGHKPPLRGAEAAQCQLVQGRWFSPFVLIALRKEENKFRKMYYAVCVSQIAPL